MNKIEKLIEELCPEGVEYRRLGDCLDYEQPGNYNVVSKDYLESGIPVLTAGQTFILGYTDEINGVYKASKDNPVIIFDDFTTSFHWVTFDFKVKSSAMKMLKPKTKDVVFRFVYHLMKCIKYETLEHSRQWISKYSKIEIPIPPISIQEKIVEILDKFTALEAELEKELEARRKQYEYYREKLLTFSTNDENVRWTTLGEIGDVCMCKRIMKNQTASIGDIPFYKIGTFGGEADAYIDRSLYDEYKSKYSFPKKGDILISAAGTIGRAVIYDGKDAYFQDSNIVWIDNDEKIILNSFLFYLYQIIDWKTDGGTIKRLYNNNLKAASIPVPPLSEQRRIVSILDRFEALTNDLQAGLPAEIAARRQQYEYYREKLLTFKRKTI